MKMNSPHGLSLTSKISKPNPYVTAIDAEWKDWAFNEERALCFKGQWHKLVFRNEWPLDLELGTGNGFYFAHHAQTYPQRNLVGIEIKYKPLIQSIRRLRAKGCENGRMVRYNTRFLGDLFQDQELDNVYIHFPDPWEKRRQNKNRWVNKTFLDGLFRLQKEDTFVEFKTDCRDYYLSALDAAEKSFYLIIENSKDLHNSRYAEKNFITHFEQIFLKQNKPIYYFRLFKEVE